MINYNKSVHTTMINSFFFFSLAVIGDLWAEHIRAGRDGHSPSPSVGDTRATVGGQGAKITLSQVKRRSGKVAATKGESRIPRGTSAKTSGPTWKSSDQSEWELCP
jgi:hypothetical protein